MNDIEINDVEIRREAYGVTCWAQALVMRWNNLQQDKRGTVNGPYRAAWRMLGQLGMAYRICRPENDSHGDPIPTRLFWNGIPLDGP